MKAHRSLQARAFRGLSSGDFAQLMSAITRRIICIGAGKCGYCLVYRGHYLWSDKYIVVSIYVVMVALLGLSCSGGDALQSGLSTPTTPT